MVLKMERGTLTKFFHTIVRRRRNRLRVNIFQNEEGEWMENQTDILDAAIRFFQKQFTKGQQCEDFSIINEIWKLIDAKKNEKLIKYPTM